MRAIAFVTNRPAIAGGFGPPPPCGADEQLSFGTVPVAPALDPAVPGRPAGPVAVAGAVACSVPGPDAALVAFLARLLSAAHAAGRTPIVLVHGYNYSFADAAARAADVCTQFENGDEPLDLEPVLFTWPSVCALGAGNYLADRARAQASANAFSRFVCAFAAAWRAAARPRALFLAHSMGTWTTQNGMRALAALPSAAALPPDLFDHAVIMGGDADADALEPGQGLDQLARLSTWLSVGVNRTDFATHVASPDILGRPRLGAAGPAHPDRIPANARIVDYTIAIAADDTPVPPGETGWNYKLHQYYRTVPSVRADLAAMLAGYDPDLIEHRFTADEMRQAGQPFIVPGRLYLCPERTPALADDTAPERRG